MIEIYASGTLSGSKGTGGWGAIISHPGGAEQHLSGGSENTTEHKMAFEAVITALNTLSAKQSIHVMTSSEFIFKGATQWMKLWMENDWKKKNGANVKNQDLWKSLVSAINRHDTVSWSCADGVKTHPKSREAEVLSVSGITRRSSSQSDEASFEKVNISSSHTHPESQFSDPESDYRVIRTDNYQRGTPKEFFVGMNMSMTQAEAVASALNSQIDADGEDFYRVVSFNYELKSPAL